MRDTLRRCIFRPYAKGMGPSFTLTTWDTGRLTYMKETTGYRLTMRDGKQSVVLFEGENFVGSSLHATDSDDAVAALMSFLTLRPGDTDADHFENYTEAQLDYCTQHAESLGCAVYARFGDR